MRIHSQRRRAIAFALLLALGVFAASLAQANDIDWGNFTTGPTDNTAGQKEKAPAGQDASVPPAQQSATTQQAGDSYSANAPVRIQFRRDERYPVYTGPGENYVRANNGKALVSTNDWIDVFGTDGEWVLIQYAKNDGAWRRGYIPRSALPPGVTVNEIIKANVQSTILGNCDLTDDPEMSRESLVRLTGGMAATFLHRDGDWAYVEVSVGGSKYRGYVPSASVQ